jgi:hypothetical protein
MQRPEIGRFSLQKYGLGAEHLSAVVYLRKIKYYAANELLK